MFPGSPQGPDESDDQYASRQMEEQFTPWGRKLSKASRTPPVCSTLLAILACSIIAAVWVAVS